MPYFEVSDHRPGHPARHWERIDRECIDHDAAVEVYADMLVDSGDSELYGAGFDCWVRVADEPETEKAFRAECSWDPSFSVAEVP